MASHTSNTKGKSLSSGTPVSTPKSQRLSEDVRLPSVNFSSASGPSQSVQPCRTGSRSGIEAGRAASGAVPQSSSSPSSSQAQPPRGSDYVSKLLQALQEQVSRSMLARVAGTHRPFRLATDLFNLIQHLAPVASTIPMAGSPS
ncbi:MAG: hypothetical protein Q9188_002406 [Gyalolechia gomerana]